MVNIKSMLHLRQKKERQTPEDRKKYGFIERHKDYKLRAENYKQNRKKQLEMIKAAEAKNPDEYTFQMEHYQTGGILGLKEIKDPLAHANDYIPDAKLYAARKRFTAQIENLKVHLYGVETGLNEEVRDEIQELQSQLQSVTDEIERRERVKLQRDKREKI